MSTYPIDEPHLAALREVCAAHEAHGRIALLSAAVASPVHQAAADAISSPSSAAQLVRDLLGACGWRVVLTYITGECVGPVAKVTSAPGASSLHIAWIWDQEERLSDHIVSASAVPALVLALLDAQAKTEGRKEAALKAMQEAGR